MSGPTRDQVVEWARETGIALFLIPIAARHQIDELERFAALAYAAGQAAEREACAEMCEVNAQRWPDARKVYVAHECAAAIRARGQK